MRPSFRRNRFALKRKYRTSRCQDELHKIYSSFFIWHQSSLMLLGWKRAQFLREKLHCIKRGGIERRGPKLFRRNTFLNTKLKCVPCSWKISSDDAKNEWLLSLDFALRNIYFQIEYPEINLITCFLKKYFHYIWIQKSPQRFTNMILA